MVPNKIFDIMDMTRRARQLGEIFNPLFVSPPGLGKTEIVQQWANARKVPFITLTLSSYDPPDFKGFPVIKEVNGRQRMDFATPTMWPDEGEGVIILEEMNRAPTSIMQCLLSLGDKRRGFDGYTLPPGWIVVGCINPENSIYDTTTMDPALVDRFELFNITYDKTSHVNYMKESGWHKDLVLFIESGVWNYSAPESIKNVPGSKYISPRTTSKMNSALKADFLPEDEMLIYNTIFGDNIGKDFYNFRHNESPVFYYDLLNTLSNALVKLKKFSDPANLKQGMISITTKDIIDNGEISDELLVKVLKAIPLDQGTALVRDLELKRGHKKQELIVRICEDYPEVLEQLKSLKWNKNKK